METTAHPHTFGCSQLLATLSVTVWEVPGVRSYLEVAARRPLIMIQYTPSPPDYTPQTQTNGQTEPPLLLFNAAGGMSKFYTGHSLLSEKAVFRTMAFFCITLPAESSCDPVFLVWACSKVEHLCEVHPKYSPMNQWTLYLWRALNSL